MFHLFPETPEDEFEVEYLFDLAFAPGREALSSYRLREGVARIADLSLVARDEFDGVAGAIRYWPVQIGALNDPVLLLGPVAVHPTHQGEGLGASLIWDSLDRARKSGWKYVILIGDEPYYGRFGFARTRGLIFPPPSNPARLLGLVLQGGDVGDLVGRVSRFDTMDGAERG